MSYLCLETVDLDVVLVDLNGLDEEFLDLQTLITLKLQDTSHLLVIDKGSIAGKLLLEHLKNFLQVKLLGESLDGGQSLSTVTLLDTDVCKCPTIFKIISKKRETQRENENPSFTCGGVLGC